MQVVFHARMAEEEGAFDFGDTVAAVCDKMTRRHPHVFGDASIADAEAQADAWEQAKAAGSDSKQAEIKAAVARAKARKAEQKSATEDA